MEAQAEAPGHGIDRGGVALCLAPAQAVIEVRDLERDAEALPGREQQVGKTGRVGAPGDGGDDPRALRDEPVAGGVRQEFREQRR